MISELFKEEKFDLVVESMDGLLPRFTELSELHVDSEDHRYQELRDTFGNIAKALKTLADQARIAKAKQQIEMEYGETVRHTFMDVLRSAYLWWVVNNESDMPDNVVDIMFALVVAGISEHDLIKLLSSDEDKSEALMPFIVAPCQRAGETVRAPAEVLEFAEDVHKYIKEMLHSKGVGKTDA